MSCWCQQKVSNSFGKIFTTLNKPEASNFIQKEALTQVLSCEFCEIFMKQLRAAASETVTDSSLGNSVRGAKFSARNEKLHVKSIFSTR